MQETIAPSVPVSPVPTTRSTRISVIIPCYNYANYIGRTLESIAAQSYRDWEVIVVDDGSKDNSVEVVEGYIRAWGTDKLRVFQQPNGYLSVARNTGFKHVSSSSEYLLFLDADDTLEPDAFSLLVEDLDRNPQASMVFCGFCFIDADDKRLPSPSEVTYYEPKLFGCLGVQTRVAKTLCEQTLPSLIGYHMAIPSTCVYRRSAFEKAGLWDESFSAVRLISEDNDMALRAALLGPVYCDPRPLVRYYRRHDSNASGSSDRMIKSNDFFQAKWKRLIAQMPSTPQRQQLAKSFIFNSYLTAFLVKQAAWGAFREGRSRDGLAGSVDALKKTARFFVRSARWARYL